MFNEYIDGQRSVQNFISDSLQREDTVERFINELVATEQVMQDFSREEIYRICEEGEKRYKKEIPPGYKDSKNKNYKSI